MSHFFTGTNIKAAVLLPVLLALLISTPPDAESQEVTGLSDWSIYIDPGHSRTENIGLFNYSEAEKVLEVSLILREMLEEQTDIEEVFMARTNHEQQVSLAERTSDANATGADFYYSVHSDAGSPSANSTLMLYGGWRENGETVEKTPKGGKDFGDIMDVILTESMRIDRRGNYADRTFYQGFPENHDNKWPYLHVNRETVMASLLSEAGFHTNPTQQMRNLNEEWRRLEAKAAFWTILEYHDLERPEVGIATGFITDSQSGETINGATVTIGEHTYTTDTYESLFHQYSNDPDELSNGFYYIDGLIPGDTVEVTVDSPNHYEKTVTAVLETHDFTFLDVELESSEAPRIINVHAYTPVDALTPGDELELTFSRIPDPDSFEDAVSFDPEADFTLEWEDDFTLIITTDSLDFEQEYTLTIRDIVVDKFNGNALDGDGDGEPGGDYVLTITTSEPDTDPPALVEYYPSADSPAQEQRPVIRMEFDEPIELGSVSRDAVNLEGPGGTIRGSTQLNTVNRRSILHFFPSSDLEDGAEYTVTIAAGLADRFGNTTDVKEFHFVAEIPEIVDMQVIDDFNDGISDWWVPQQSGSTSGIITDLTEREPETRIVNAASGSSGSMRLSYGWETDASTHLIRQYLAPGADQNLRFDDSYVLEAYVFGDGSGNRFRFMLRDGNNELEGSEWYDIDWKGWKRVAWDLSNDPVVPWVNGNGQLNGQLYTDSFQLTWEEDAATTGTIYIDDYRIVEYYEREPTSGSDHLADVPDELSLAQNYPNPFNPTTVIRYDLPSAKDVTLEVFDMLGRRVTVLVDQHMEAGQHETEWDATQVSSGVYIYKLQAGSQTLTRKMTLVK